ncbi:MAG: isocitrate lyase/phosphoenolpyruvate mutase family protein, partial [Clostridia bacterium]|nr:isocitrate lyase/phosphoenolpyruvate mutase family protein [Clostridia bacterium]
ARELGAPMTMLGGTRVLADGIKQNEVDKGWKMWPDVTLIDGKPAVELEDVKKLGYNFVTMHVFEKSALYGMIKYAREDWTNKDTVFTNTFDMGGLLTLDQLKAIMSMKREF